MALAENVGRREAHALVESASRRTAVEGSRLEDTLANDPAVTRWLSPADIRAKLDPAAYLGAALVFVNRVLKRHDS